ncbi:MAG: carbohydrate ABC transporter permease [Clostridia bacterium]|nr:carbohydrate ABC transporter permease [Clostridia bacterium]
MQKVEKKKFSWQEFKASPQYFDKKSRTLNGTKNFFLALFRLIIIVGISYIILAPVIEIIARSFFSEADSVNPMVFTIPISPTLERYEKVLQYMDYLPILGNTLLYVAGVTLAQLLICSMVGYGFARYRFPLKGVFFAFVVVMIVVPMSTIQFPLYVAFRYFNVLPYAGIAAAFGIFLLVMGIRTRNSISKWVTIAAGAAVVAAAAIFAKQYIDGGSVPINLHRTVWPTFIMTIFGCGLRSGLYIYIFNQFFRGLPKEIEEAALVDGAGTFYTYFRIMMPNATPAVITVAVFSIVWQYNDSFFASNFTIPDSVLITQKLAGLVDRIANAEKIYSLREQRLYFNAGVVLVLVPIVLIYVILQRRFIEGVERSGIVG